MQMVKCNDARVRITTTINSVAVDWSELLSQFPPDAEFTVVLRFGYNLVLDNTACGTQQTQGHITWHFLPANIPLTVGITARSSIRSRSNGETREVAKENESVEGSSSTLYSNSFPTRTKQHFPCAQGRSQWGVMVLTPEHELGPWVFASTRKWLLAWQPDFAAASRPRDSEYNKQQRQFLDNLYRWALFTLPQGHEDGDDDDDEEEEEFKIEFGETVSFAALPAVTVTSDTSACVSSTVLAAPDGRKLERLVALANPTMRYCIDLTAGDVDWGKSKRLRRYRSNFRLSMNHDYRASVAHLIEYHKTSGNGVWFVPELFELFCAMVDDGPASVVHPIAFELWEGEVLVAVTAGYAIGRAFHDYSMATFVRDKRGCGAILTQVVGEALKQAGYELWYWGFKGAYMTAYDKMGGNELTGEEFGERWSKLIVDESDGLSSWERCLRIRELVYDGHAMVLPKSSDTDVVAGVASEDVTMSTTTSGSALVDM
jgi:Leu/Phe-tRNA-protein transferase